MALFGLVFKAVCGSMKAKDDAKSNNSCLTILISVIFTA